MIFQTEGAIEKVVRGEKTQTRRIVKLEHRLMWGGTSDDNMQILRVSRLTISVYEVGKTYAVQPGRGKAGMHYGELPMLCPIPEWATNADPIRIRITAIRHEDVRQISEADAIAEGYDCIHDFWFTWIEIHDKSYLETYRYAVDTDYLREYGFYVRPAERYQAWTLLFEVAK